MALFLKDAQDRIRVAYPRHFALFWRYKGIIKYLISGGTAAVVDIGLLYIFKEYFGYHYLGAATLAFIFAFFVSFSLQKFWTFKDHSTKNIHGQLGMYLLVALINLGLNTGLMYLFVDIFHVHYILSQIIVAGTIAIGSFTVYGKFIFKKKII